MSEEEKKKLKKFSATTPRKRFFKLAGMSAKIAGKVTSSAVKGVFRSAESKDEEKEKLLLDVGLQIAETLGEMKGAVMKVGQIASQIQDLLPEEIASSLQTLQKNSPPMPFEVIQSQITSELGSGPFALFETFDPEPFAAATIGQVHRAMTFDGKDVVVKIQYPGVHESCDSDLKHLRVLLKLGGLVKVEKEILDNVFDEIRQILYEELDYEHEAENIRLMREFHMHDDKIVIPDIVEEFTSKRVITLIYEGGDNLEEVSAANSRYSQETINGIGDRLFHMVASQIYKLNAVHCDPHPGNFAFRPDGTIVVYDFGAVKHLDPKMITEFQQIIRSAMERDYVGIEEGLRIRGIRKTDNIELGEEFYKPWLDILLKPFSDHDTDFDFGESKLHEELVRNAQKNMLKNIGMFQPSPETMQVDRVVSGHYWNLMNLGVKAAFRKNVDYYMSLEQKIE
ncbi:MAG: AarF/ABC1/UbiB kinase family protein [Pseudomonadales bacterium]|nr:AarF/ABC1/UbiB kinase family protein [Pseudomonadales bacterium]